MTEQRYTLEEARKIIRREECRRDGHDWTTVANQRGASQMFCSHCDATATVHEKG